MLWNYLKSTLRNIIRHKSFALINIIGLAVGIGAFIIIALYLHYEFSYDKHHKDAENIYRLVCDAYWESGNVMEISFAPAPAANDLPLDYPFIEAATKVGMGDRVLIEIFDDDSLNSVKSIYEKNVLLADSGYCRVFQPVFVEGSAKKALTEPNTVVITQSLAEKLYGKDSLVMGNILKLEGTTLYKICGVIKDFPGNTHLDFNMMMSGYEIPMFQSKNYFTTISAYVYFRTNKPIDKSEFEKELKEFYKRHTGQEKEYFVFSTENLTDLHLKSHRLYDFGKKGNINILYALAIVAVLILLAACINYMNLSTARSSYRTKEIAVRKVSGAKQSDLLLQFMGESVLIALFALFLAVVLVESFLPEFRRLLEIDMRLDYGKSIVFLLILGLLTGFIAGFYPSLYMSRLMPMKIIMSKSGTGSKKAGIIRKILVVIQYSFTIMLVFATIVILSQLSYLQNKELGFEKENVVKIKASKSPDRLKEYTFKNKLKNIAGVDNVSVSNTTPGFLSYVENVKPETYEDYIPIKSMNIDYDFINVYKIPVLAGNAFDKSNYRDSAEIIINAKAALTFGYPLDSVINRKVLYNVGMGNGLIEARIAGVVADFNFNSLHEEIEPLVLLKDHRAVNNPNDRIFVSVKLNTHDNASVIKEIENVYNEYYSDFPFEYGFVKDEIYDLYKEENKLKTIIWYFTLLIVIIASLGLYGLSAFNTERRFKEIGIRKTFGEPAGSIVWRLSREIIVLLVISCIIAMPLSWYILKLWLQNFAYQTSIQWWMYLLAAVVSICIAFLTISTRSFKAANSNPVDALRYE